MIDTDSRLDFLKVCQNRDGGWGYFPGKQSWLEPTVYACLALHGDAVTDRAWSLIRSWQLPSGAFRPSAAVGDEFSRDLLQQLFLHEGRSKQELMRGLRELENAALIEKVKAGPGVPASVGE